MSLLKGKNKNFNWILTCIDVFSRYSWAIPVKKKTGVLVTEAFAKILKDGQPLRVTSDNGSEFINSNFQKLLRKHKITHFLNQPGDHNTMRLIERFNRTLRGLMGRNYERIGKLIWINDLPNLIHNYNNNIHRTLGQTPKSIWNKNEISKQKINRETFTLQPGNTVRLLLKRNIFEKGTSQNWSKSIYTVVQRVGFKYEVKNKNGEKLKTKYRQTELLKTTSKEIDKIDIEKAKKVVQKVKRVKRVLKKRGIDKSKVIRVGIRGKRKIKKRTVFSPN